MTDKTVWSWKDIEKALAIPDNNKIMEFGTNIASKHFVGGDLEKDDVINYVKDIVALDIPVEQKLVLALSQWDFLVANWNVKRDP